MYTGSSQFVLPPVLEEIGVSEHGVVHKPVLDIQILTALIGAETDSEFKS